MIDFKIRVLKMISRNNYEEFFLMYVDSELSATEKEIVEVFVQQNPDLQEELTMLQQAVLLPENDVVFADKNLLFKQIGNEISTINFEEKFLLYIDNELTTKDKAEVETFVLQHPELQNDFTLLKQTKLEVETIACPNKEALYKEEKERRVVYINWYKMAAAALIIGLIGILYFIIPNNKNLPQNGLVKVGEKTTIPATQKTVVTPAIEQAIIKHPTDKVSTSNKETYLADNRAATKKNNIIITPKNTNKPEVFTKVGFKPGAIDNLQDPPIKMPVKEEIIVTNSGVDRTTNSNLKNEIIDGLAKLPTVTNALATTTKTNTIAQQIVYKELDTNDDQKSLLVGSVEINKDKLRGFLRKASKLFGNKQKNEDHKSFVASNK